MQNALIDKEIKAPIYKHNRINVTSLNKFVIWTTLLFMPLSTYAVPIEGMTVGDLLLGFCLIIVMLILCIKGINLKKIISIDLLSFILFIVFMSLMYGFIDPGIFETRFLSLSRYVLYLTFVMFTARFFLEKEYVLKVYKLLAILFSCYIIAQFVSFNIFGIILPSAFFGLPTYAIDMNAEAFKYSTYLLYRPRSVFLEPAHFAAYQLPILYLVLNSKEYVINKRYLVGMFITLGLIISGSTTAIIMLIFCWFKPMVSLIKKMNIKSIGVMVFLIIGSTVMLNAVYIQRVIGRFWIDGRFHGSSVTGRFGGYSLLFDSNIPFFKKLFGYGFGFESGYYLPSYGTLLLYLGYIGVVVFLVIILHTYFHSSKDGKGIILLALILFTGTNSLFGIASVPLFALVYSDIGRRQNTV